MDLGRTVVDSEWPDIAVDAFHNGISGDADRSESLHAAIDHAIQRFGAKYLGHACFIARLVTLVEEPRGMPDRQARHMQIDFIIGEHEPDALMLPDCFSERAATPRVFGGDGMAATRGT